MPTEDPEVLESDLSMIDLYEMNNELEARVDYLDREIDHMREGFNIILHELRMAVGPGMKVKGSLGPMLRTLDLSVSGMEDRPPL